MTCGVSSILPWGQVPKTHGWESDKDNKANEKDYGQIYQSKN